MKFDKVAMAPTVTLENIYPLFVNRVSATDVTLHKALDEKLIHALMQNTTDNIQVTLGEHELLYVVIETQVAICISNIITDTQTFNLGSLLKLLKGTLSTNTYFVVMNQARTDSVCIKEVLAGNGCHAMHQTQELLPCTGNTLNLK